MSDEIRADYNQLEEIAGRFNNQAQAIEQMNQKVRGSYDKLRDGGWIGMGADAFFDEMESVLFPATIRLKDALEEAGRATQNVSQTVKQAEDDAGGLFRV